MTAARSPVQLTLAGSVLLVTGGAKNLGRRIALDAAELGATVVVNTRSDRDRAEAVADEIRSRGGAAIACIADVTDPDQVDRMAQTAKSELGAISALVHCASHRGTHRPITEISVEEWQRVVEVTLDGAFLCTRAALPQMFERGYGRIVYIGGPASYTGRPRGSTHGASAKAGLEALARSVAQEFAARGVTANVVTPGPMATDRAVAAGSGSSAPELIELGEVAQFVLRLCAETSRGASGADYVLGPLLA